MTRRHQSAEYALVQEEYCVDEFIGIDHHSQLPDELVSSIGLCVLEAFGSSMAGEDVSPNIHGEQVIAVYPDVNRTRVVAFGAADILSPRSKFGDESLSDRIGCYFAAATIAPDFQGRGIYRMLNARRLQFAVDSLLDTIFTQTQNPRVQEGITNTIRRLEPTTGVSLQGIDRVVRRGAYGKMLTDTQPFARQLSYDDIDYDAGDAAVVTWQLG